MTFIDTNVLVYAAVDGSPMLDRARAALTQVAANGPATISRQILREYLSVMTRQQIWGKPLTLTEAIADTAEFIRQFTFWKTAQRSGTGSSCWAAVIPLPVGRFMTPT